MKTIQKYEIYLLLFITNAVAMLLELVAARILSPLYGSSNTIWTIIITVMLLANAVGNLLGGKLSDKYKISSLKSVLLFLSGAFTLLIAIINGQVMNNIIDFKDKSTIGFSISEIVLFLLPCVTIGAFSPIINKVELTEKETVGKKSGHIYTVITVGSLFGTVFGGLVLIPHFGCAAILYGTAIMLLAYALIYAFSERSKFSFGYGFALILSVILTVQPAMGGNSNMIILDTNENYVRIYDAEKDGEPVRMFSVGGGFSSVSYIAPEKQNELIFTYTQAYNRALDAFPEAKDFLMMGGAGYSYPRYLISHYDDKTIDVVEIDGGVTEAAKKYFFLQDFIDQYGTDRLGLYTDDARQYLQKTEKKYDIIMNDCFTGHSPVRGLATAEAVMDIKAHLTENGIYATNINHPTTRFFTSEVKTLLSSFQYVWVQLTDEETPDANWMIFASDHDYGFDTEHVQITDDDIVFTDDYAPVEVFDEISTERK